MDYLYSNLENYEEEQTFAELRNENADLKAKLQEYSSALEKLQKEFDKLTSEHKKLETNYSSLLKTAKAEIERKTEIINNLNNEKDAMVLNSIQNNKFINKPWLMNKTKQNELKKFETIVDKRSEPDLRSSPRINVERKESIKEAEKPTRLSESKENVVQHKESDAQPKRSSRIRDRRKSMPAFSIEQGNIGSDDEKPSRKKEFTDRSHDRNYKKGPELSNDRHFSNEQNRSRLSRHYNDDKLRYRDKNEYSQRYKHNSPGHRSKSRPREYSPGIQSKSRPREYDDYYERIDDRHRREDASRNQYGQRSRERHRTNYDPYQEHERYKYHDKFPMKHKLPNDYEEPSSKRMKPEIHRNYEERWQNEQQMYDFEDMQFSSCQSPDSLYFELNPNHQIREIKLNSSSKLEDPRTLSNKYERKNKDGKTVLTTVGSKEIDIQPIDKFKWNIETVSMPEALMNRPPTHEVDQIPVSLEDPPNTSMETDEIRDSDIESYKTTKSDEIIPPVGNTQITTNTEIQKSYRIPKKKNNEVIIPKCNTSDNKTINDTNQSIKDVLKSEQDNICAKSLPKMAADTVLNKSLLNAKGTVDQSTKDVSNKPVEKENICAKSLPKMAVDTVANKSHRDTKVLGNQSIQDVPNKPVEQENICAKNLPKMAADTVNKSLINMRGVVEGDLELSDEASDCAESHIKTTEINKTNIVTDSNKPPKDTHKDKDNINLGTNKATISKTIDEAKKTKTRKKTKLKKDNDDSQTTDNAKKTKGSKKQFKEISPVTEKIKDKNAKDTVKEVKGEEKNEFSLVIDKDKIQINVLPELEHSDPPPIPKEIDKSNEEQSLPVLNAPEKKRKVNKSDAKTKTDPKVIKENITEKDINKTNKEIKNKFSELFGDSNSLIYPEDLGIAASVPLAQSVPYFEDAQDAIDIKNSHEENANTSHITITDLAKHANANEMINIKQIYENLEVIPTNDSKVVKTVIISSGIQPNLEQIDCPTIAPNVAECNTVPKVVEPTNTKVATVIEPNTNNNLKALATSTPYKVLNTEVDNTNSIETRDSLLSDTTTNDTDAPDVRIFVRRRRKTIKKTQCS